MTAVRCLNTAVTKEAEIVSESDWCARLSSRRGCASGLFHVFPLVPVFRRARWPSCETGLPSALRSNVLAEARHRRCRDDSDFFNLDHIYSPFGVARLGVAQSCSESNPKVVSSNPTPATKNFLPFSNFSVPRNHPNWILLGTLQSYT